MFENFQQMSHFVTKYRQDIENIENAKRLLEENETKLLAIIIDLWEKTKSDKMITLMDEVYQEEKTIQESVKVEIPEELLRKRKTQKEYAQELGITPTALSKRIKRRKKNSSTELKSKKREM
jgi:Trp operon repressor